MNSCLSYIFVFALFVVVSCVSISTTSSGGSNTGSSSGTVSSPPSGSGSGNPSTSNSSQGYYTQFNHKNFRDAAVFKGNASNDLASIRKINAILFFMVNEERAKAGKPIIPYHEALEVAAYYHSLEMAERDFFSHQNPKNPKRRETSDRAKLAGVANPFIAENIVSVYSSSTVTLLSIAEKMMNQWMNSKGHKSNILSTDSKQLGCGVYVKNKEWYGTQVFQWFAMVESQSAVDKF